MSSVTFPVAVGGDGSTVTDGSDANGLAGPTGRGYKTKLIPAFSNIVNIAQVVVDAGEAATNAANVNGTSTSSVATGSGSKTFTYVEADRTIVLGMWLNVASAADPGDSMTGYVTAWNSGTRAVTILVGADDFSGSGTNADWVVSLTGRPGPPGAGSGDVTGPASSVNNELALFSGTGGKTLKSSGGVVLDTDTTLAANSDTRLATQKATKAYVDAMVTGLLDFKGSTDCSGNPNYPAALKGDAYVVSVAGKIGGASGASVDVGDVYVASADNAGGTQASVGASWFILEHNLAGVATLTGAETLTNKTLTSPVITGGTNDTFGIGFKEIPSNSQSTAYTAVLADSGKSIDHPSSDANARTFTIPANASVAYPVGTCLSFSNMTSQVVTIAITSDTLYLAGTGSTGSRSLAQYGVATARKLTSTTWLISGVGLT